MKRFIQHRGLSQIRRLMMIWIAATLAVPPVYGRDEGRTNVEGETTSVYMTTSVEIPETGETAVVTVAEIETTADGEKTLLDELAKDSPDGVVVLENQAQGPNAQTRPELVPVQYLPNPDNANFFGRAINKFKSWFYNHPKTRGFLISVAVTGVGMLGNIYFEDKSFETSAKIGLMMLTIGTFHATFTKQWRTFIGFGGQAFLRTTEFIARLFNHQIRDSVWREKLDAIGKLATVVGFTVGTTATTWLWTGDYQSALMALVVGAVNSYDYTIDILASLYKETGRLDDRRVQQIIQGRVLFGPVLENLSLGGSVAAQSVMAVIGLTGVLAIFKSDQVYELVSTSKSRAVRIALNVKNIKGKVIMLPRDLTKLVELSKETVRRGVTQAGAIQCQTYLKPRWAHDDLQ